ncbi:molybdopterin cofactor sulfurase [Pochonia chlamydosporia 170]|uniref:Molybdopterin cofactor sulfurase n=1 Tax=Pochonia chlamydosporia 170 TaxID=1380566 RepID=A0A179FJI2_METCM|nr:molybdopterin cofactor sulfurase [Pochonia chlamydosporia 170]OAQ65421.1 molybdopterin cofactor sulfurase [Pochonia chlamydosporia 170]
MLLSFLQTCRAALTPSLILQGIAVLAVLLSSVIAGVIYTGRNYAIRRELRQLRRVGVPVEKSNMKDQYDSQFDLAEGSTATGPIRIKAIYIHPVKSFGPIELNRALLTKSGFMYDRCFAFAAEVIEPDLDTGARNKFWRFLSQRTKPGMSLIETELWLPHENSNPNDALVRAGGCVVIRFPDPENPTWLSWFDSLLYTWNPSAIPQVSFIAPLNPSAAQLSTHDLEKEALRPFTIHARTAHGIDMSIVPSVAAALPKLKKFLKISDNTPVTIFKCTDDTLVRTTKNLAPLKYIGSPAVHGYTDQQPIHLSSLSSVHAFSELLPRENQPLNALRFRANIWVTGASAYDEESWKRYRILPGNGAIETHRRARVDPVLCVVCRTSRCTMPNVDPDKGVFNTDTPAADRKKGKPQPSTTLIEYRTVENGNKAALGYMGMHCVPEDRSLNEAQEQNAGLYVQVGDEIEVLERGEHLYGSTGDDY